MSISRYIHTWVLEKAKNLLLTWDLTNGFFPEWGKANG